jgi:hypothetical protein
MSSLLKPSAVYYYHFFLTFLDNEEFEDFQGFLRLAKIPSLNKFLTYPHETEIFGFKATKKGV